MLSRDLLLRRHLLAGAAVGLGAAALSQRAQADTAFTTFAFPATKNANAAARTMPDRISDVFNVLDFGAKGDNSHDDQPAIQAAVNALQSQSGHQGVVFFPPGLYKVNNPIDFSFGSSNAPGGVCFLGCGAASQVIGNFNSSDIRRFVFDRRGNNQQSGLFTIEKLWIQNQAAGGGAVRLGSGTVQGAVRDCTISADLGVICCSDLTATDPVTSGASYECAIDSCNFYSVSGASAGNSIAVYIAENSVVRNADFNNYYVGIMIGGNNNVVICGRIEVSMTAVRIGQLPSGTVWSSSGFSIIGLGFESNGIAIDMPSANKGLISAIQLNAFTGAAPYQGGTLGPFTITGSVSGATATGCTINGSTAILTIPAGGITGTFQPNVDFLTGTGLTGAAANTFMYLQQTGTSGKDGTYFLKGTPQYGIHIANGGDNCTQTVFEGLDISANFNGAAIAVADAATQSSNRSNNTFTSCSARNNLGTAWRMPTTAGVAKFIQCNTDEPVYTFANLNIFGGTSRLRGDDFWISDGQKSGGGAAVWGDIVSGGGTGQYKVLFNGTNWIRIG